MRATERNSHALRTAAWRTRTTPARSRNYRRSMKPDVLATWQLPRWVRWTRASRLPHVARSGHGGDTVTVTRNRSCRPSPEFRSPMVDRTRPIFGLFQRHKGSSTSTLGQYTWNRGKIQQNTRSSSVSLFFQHQPQHGGRDDEPIAGHTARHPQTGDVSGSGVPSAASSTVCGPACFWFDPGCLHICP